MSTTAARTDNVARKRPNPERDLIQLRAEPAWIDRVVAAAERLGLNLSAYIRLAVSEKMNRDGDPKPRRKVDAD